MSFILLILTLGYTASFFLLILFNINISFWICSLIIYIIFVFWALLSGKPNDAEGDPNSNNAEDINTSIPYNTEDDVISKLSHSKRKLNMQVPKIVNSDVRSSVQSISVTLEKIIDEVSRDPQDIKRVKNLAYNSCDMLIALIKQYIEFESLSNTSNNIVAALEKIAISISKADDSLKVLLDDLFTNDVMRIEHQIAVLEKLLDLDSPKNRMNFLE